MLKSMIVFAAIWLAVSGFAENSLYVDNVKGSDRNNGSEQKPLRTFRKAVRLLKPGMTLYLVPNKNKPYKHSLVIKRKPSTTDKLITIDGQGAILNGLTDTKRKWTLVKDGLYKRKIRRPKGFYVQRHFMVIDGHQQRMGIYKKLTRKSLKEVEELEPGEWTYNEDDGVLFLKLAKKLEDTELLEPADKMASGVMIQASSNVKIKNITVEYFKNDGYNISEDSKNVIFENIIAKYCGDDGISAHQKCEIKVRKFVSIGNVSAICHVQESTSENEDILIKDSLGTDLYLFNKSNTFKNLVVDSSGFVRVLKGELYIENALFTNPQNDNRAIFSITTRDAEFKNVMIKNRRITHNKARVEYFENGTQGFDDSFVEKVKQFNP